MEKLLLQMLSNPNINFRLLISGLGNHTEHLTLYSSDTNISVI